MLKQNPGYAGEILNINLSTYKIIKKPLPLELIKNYIGGKGIATRLLCDNVPGNVNPLGPENKLIFASGPATGTPIPNKGYVVAYKSPQTGVYASSSSGGRFAVDLKQAGFDVLIIMGQAKKPVYIWIDDGKVEFRTAEHLWGKDVYETDELLKEEIGDNAVNTARIGPAGEKLVRFSGVFNDHSRTAGRCGAGAVMGSKKLKAIAVRGTGNINVSNIEGVLDFAKELHQTVDSEMASYQRFGTPASVSVVSDLGVFPTRYFHKQQFSEHEKINATTMCKNFLVKSKACYSCSAHCGKLCEVKDGKYKGAIAEIDFETLYALGSLCENNNLASIIKANELCDKLGIDTISTGNVIAFAMECYDRGIITKKETDGVELTWGNHEAVVELVEKIALRKGLGNILAEGIRPAAKKFGKEAEKYAIHVKGLEPAAFDPRGFMGAALSFAVADRGACHLPGSLYTWEVKGRIDPHVINDKPILLKEFEERFAVCDSMIICRFVSRDIYPWKQLAKALPLLTGIERKENELKRIGERIVMLTRVFNVSTGVTRKDDDWPERIYNEPISNGPMKGRVLKKSDFNKMLDDYYQLKGWDKNGIPTRERLIELGLEKYASKTNTSNRKIAEVKRR